MPLGISFGSKSKAQSKQKLYSSSTDLRSGSNRTVEQQQLQQHQHHQHHHQHHQHHQHQLQHQQQAETVFRLTFLGKQSLSRPNSTGFGSVQKPLRDIYLGHVIGCRELDKSADRTVTFRSSEMQIRYVDTVTGQVVQENFPLDSVAYLDVVLLHTVKGKKRHFAYFRRHTDRTDVIPDAVLVPLHKKEHKAVSRRRQLPLLCLLLRRPHGIQFLECHVFEAPSSESADAFLREFDSRSCERRQQEQQGGLFNYTPWQPGRWCSQPQLAQARCHRQPSTGSDASSVATHSSASSSSVGQQQQPQLQQQYQMQRQYQQQQQQQQQQARTEDPTSIRRSASGTIFDKFSELLAFNIPEYEYVGFHELRPPPTSASDNSIRSRHRQQVPEHRPSVILEESGRQRGENVSHLVQQFEEIRWEPKPVARVAPTARPPLPQRQQSGGSGGGGSGGRKVAARSASASGRRRARNPVTSSNPDFQACLGRSA